MLAHSNGDPLVCALNLLRTIRGEVPMSRVKGIDREHIDKPASRSAELQADAEWVLENYEPRLEGDDITVLAADAARGNYNLKASGTATETV